jgi:hypothetical protein
MASQTTSIAENKKKIWSADLRPKVGQSVTHLGRQWVSLSGINSEPSLSNDNDWLLIQDNSGGPSGGVNFVSNVATDTILGRISASSGNSEQLTPTQLRELINVEDDSDKTDSANVTSAGALMDSEVTNLTQVKAFDASDYEPTKGTDDNYVTDAEKTVIGNTSGTNTGDQDLSGLEVKRTNKPITESTYLIKAADVSEFLIFSNACTVVVPNGLATDLEFQGKQGGTGQVTFSAESGGTLNVFSEFLKETAGQHCFFGIRTDGSDVSTILGTLKLA